MLEGGGVDRGLQELHGILLEDLNFADLFFPCSSF
jgi:hypothetical protein